jgi:hypothetical protein
MQLAYQLQQLLIGLRTIRRVYDLLQAIQCKALFCYLYQYTLQHGMVCVRHWDIVLRHFSALS